jgi:hypothetical protein
MEDVLNTTGESGDLFTKRSMPRSGSMVRRKLPPEWVAARVLCRQLRRKQAPREKQRIAHLICLNLLSMLRHGS